MKDVVYTIYDAVADAHAALARELHGVGQACVRYRALVRLRARVDGTVPRTTRFDGAVDASPGCRLKLGEHVRFGARVWLETAGAGSITVGSNVRINAGTFIVSHAAVEIGDDVLIGEYVGIRDGNHGVAPGEPMRQQPHDAAPVQIGDGAWVARGAVVLKGVTIGRGAVVAANAVVTRDVPDGAVVAGVPATVKRFRDGYGPDANAEAGDDA